MARIAGNVCNTYIHIDLLVEEISTSIENNTSTVTWSLVGYMGAGGTSAQWYSNSYHTINVNINGKSVYSLANTTQKVISIGTNATQSNPTVIASGTATVPHNEDGTKNCACSFSVVYRYSSAFSWSGSGNVALTNIARATVPRLSVSSAKLGDKVTISLPRASANYTHRIDYDVKSLVSGLAGGGTSGTVTGTSYEWTVPTNLSQYFPSERSTTVTFTVTTYNGSKQVGTPQTATLKVNVPDYTPTISSVSITDPKGYLNTYGGFVQGKSNANVAITASGKYDSSIILYLANVEKGYNSTSSSITTDTLLNSGTTTATIKVVDSRSKVATVTQNITVLPYAAPVIASFNAYRCKSATDSTVDDMGEYIAVSHSTSVSSLNSKNTKTVTVQYRQAGATQWNTLSGSIFTASSDKRWEVRLTVTDKIGESAIATKEVPVAYTLLDFNASGKGMAIGKVSEDNTFDVNMDAKFRKVLIAERGMYTADTGLVEWGRSGYVVLARMEVYAAWVSNSEFEFEIKGKQGGGKILFRLNDAETLENVDVAAFTADYMLPDAWYTLTRGSETITIDLIIRKEAYEDYRIVNLITTSLVFQKIRFSFPGTYESTLRDGVTKAGNRTTYMANGIASNIIASIGDVIAGYGTDSQISLNSIWSTLSNLANSHKFALYVLTDIDNLQQGIGMNIIDSSLYIAFFYSWIGLEFRVGSADIRIRKRYGSSGWSDWKTLMGF